MERGIRLLALLLVGFAFAVPKSEGANSEVEVEELRAQVRHLELKVKSQRVTIDKLKKENRELRRAAKHAGATPNKSRRTRLGRNFLKPGRFGVGTPERTLAEYMSAWKKHDWRLMWHVTGGGGHGYGGDKMFPFENMARRHKDKELINFRILKAIQTSKTAAEIAFIVEYENAQGEIVEKEFRKKIIKGAYDWQMGLLF